ncbi:unconventional prefoldin RPB5 interactor-like protein isoform X2 [Anabrus simplex]
MVPVGPRALMKGKIVHTNEILVRLGEDWFAKRSAAQASEICQRRLALCKEKLAAIDKAKQLLNSRKEFPVEEEAYGEKEIVEVCTEDELEQWRAEHRRKEKEYRKQLAELCNKEKTTINNEEDLWKRLDELELQEELEDELNRLHGDDDQDEDEDDDDDDDDDSGLSDDAEDDMVSVTGNDSQAEYGKILRKVVVENSETAANKPTTAGRRVSFPTNHSEENEETSNQIPTSSSGRRVSFADIPPEEISSHPNDNDKSDSSIQLPGSQSAPDLTSMSIGEKNSNSDQISLKSPKSILKIKNSDPSTIYTQEPDSSVMSSLMDDEDLEPEIDSVILPPPVSSAVLEHNPENIEQNDSSTERPISRFRAARKNKR